MDRETWQIIIRAVIMILSALISAYVVPYLKSKIGEDKFKEIQRYAEWAVRSAEQIYTEEEWKLKKQYAMEFVATKVGELNISLSATDIEALIESTVNYIKYGTEYSK